MNGHKSVSLLACPNAVLGVALWFYGTTAAGQEALLNKVSVDDDRPLYHAVQQVAEQTRTLITFEEMIFEHREDLKEYRNRRGETTLIPKNGKFDFEYQSSMQVDEVLYAMVDQYNSAYPGNYKVIGEDDVFHIIPDASKDPAGDFVPRKSLLDATITINFTSNNAHDMACDIVQQASIKNNVDLTCLSDLTALSSKTIENISTTSEIARDVLVDILKQSGGGLSWVILRSATRGNYVISFIGQSNQ